MRRHQLFEIHEQPWLPNVWRELFQLSLGRAVSLMKAIEGFSDRFRRFLEDARPASVLELASGSGELSVELWRHLFEGENGEVGRVPRLVLSDLFPNEVGFSRFKKLYPRWVDAVDEPVDALAAPVAEDQALMMLEGLHHFSPEQLRQMFRHAEEHSRGFVAFETTRRQWKNIGMVLLTAPTTLLIAGFMVRPFRLRNLLWGLLLPVVPALLVIDGILSNLRSYTVEEFRDLVGEGNDVFVWEVDEVVVQKAMGLKAIYVIGWRKHGQG